MKGVQIWVVTGKVVISGQILEKLNDQNHSPGDYLTVSGERDS